MLKNTHQLFVVAGIVLLAFLLVACTSNESEMADGDSSDGDVIDGDAVDGDSADGDMQGLTYNIVDTGQSTCYDDLNATICPAEGAAFFGQDAQYDGNAPRYVDNGDGTVSDKVTGLMWQQNPGEKQQYADAIAGIENFSLAGYDDWRIPTIKELYSLILFSGRDVDPTAIENDDMTPFIDDETFAFSYGDPDVGDRVIDSQWVTSSIYTDSVMNNQECFFGVNFADGRIKCYPTSNKTYYAIYVRGGNGYGVNKFSDNGDDTITDSATGLMWMKKDSQTTMNWEDALAYCESLNLAGYDDWKLPDPKQLQSIVDYTRSPGATNSASIDPVFSATGITNEAGHADFGFYWTRTTHVNSQGGADAAYVAFGRAMGYMNNQWMDVHGAGAQRSDPKAGDPADIPIGQGPQGDVRRIYNFARCVRDSNTFNANPDGNVSIDGDVNIDGDEPPADGDSLPADGDAPVGPISCSEEADCQDQAACPPDAALGCVCSATPDGKLCLPSCNSDSDCPEPPDTTLVCDQNNHLCIPANG